MFLIERLVHTRIADILHVHIYENVFNFTQTYVQTCQFADILIDSFRYKLSIPVMTVETAMLSTIFVSFFLTSSSFRSRNSGNSIIFSH